MLVTALLVLLFLCLACAKGQALLALMCPLSPFKPGDRLIISGWLGTILMATLLLAVTPFTGLTFKVWLLVEALSLLTFLIPRSSRESFKGIGIQRLLQMGGFLALASISAAVYAVRALNTNLDTGLYHLPIIKWFAELGAVPGLGILDPQFGIISANFALGAPFYDVLADGRLTHFTGAVFLALTACAFAVCVRRVVMGQGRASDIFMVMGCGIVLPFIFRLALPISPSPNFPANLLVVVISWLALVIVELDRQAAKDGRYVLPMLFAVLGVNLKLNILPFLLLGVVYFIVYWQAQPRKQLVGLWLGVLTVLGLVFPAVSFYMSACPLFPAELFCADLPWSAQPIENTVFKFASSSGNNSQGEVWYTSWPFKNGLMFSLLLLSIPSALLVLVPRRKLQLWLPRLSLGIAAVLLAMLATGWLSPLWIGKTFAMISVGGLAVGLLWLVVGYQRRSQPALIQGRFALLTLVATAVVGYVLLALYGPSSRFGLGYAAMLPALAVAYGSVERRRPKWAKPFAQQPRWAMAAALGVLVLFAAGSLRKAYTETLLPQMEQEGLLTLERDTRVPWLLPYKLRRFEYTGGKIFDIDFQQHNSAQGISYWFPGSSGLCWDQPLPCSIQKVDDDVVLRDPQRGIAGGFVRLQ